MQGCIVHLGPSYSDTVSSFEAEKGWKASFERYYDKSKDLTQLRKQEELHTARLVEMTDTEVAKICSLESPKVEGLDGDSTNAAWFDLDWLTDKPYGKQDDSVLEQLRAFANMIPLKEQHNPQEPRRFLGSNCFMGLAPGDAKLGDLIVRFWGCDVAVILRDDPGKGLHIVGRADDAAAR